MSLCKPNSAVVRRHRHLLTDPVCYAVNITCQLENALRDCWETVRRQIQTLRTPALVNCAFFETRRERSTSSLPPNYLAAQRHRDWTDERLSGLRHSLEKHSGHPYEQCLQNNLMRFQFPTSTPAERLDGLLRHWHPLSKVAGGQTGGYTLHWVQSGKSPHRFMNLSSQGPRSFEGYPDLRYPMSDLPQHDVMIPTTKRFLEIITGFANLACRKSTSLGTITPFAY